ncbi:MAG: nucleotidyltransferase substrate binding protein [Rectinemataceae bacterium]|jgi:nucleotidyltransferase substrate binding protein (TIGR01987 family)
MDELKEKRWRQRFSNLLRAFALFDEGVKSENLNRLEKEGLIQRFEYTFELSWKTMKDYLEGRGIATDYPRETIRESFARGLVEDGEVWMDMLERRNLLSHTYDEKSFETACGLVCGPFHSAIGSLVARLKREA